MIAVTRPVSDTIANCELTHLARQPIDLDRARAQHRAYERALEDAGCTIVRVEAAPDLPDAVFVEDAAVVLPEIAIITRPGAPLRRKETPPVAAVLGRYREMAAVEAPATLDGGDVLQAGGRLYVGVGGRTSAAGATMLGDLLGVEVVAVALEGVLHLKSAFTALPDGTVVCCAPSRPFESFLSVPEESGAHVVVLGERSVLLAADCPRSAELFAARGLEPVVVDISEFQKLEGCVTCLSVLL